MNTDQRFADDVVGMEFTLPYYKELTGTFWISGRCLLILNLDRPIAGIKSSAYYEVTRLDSGRFEVTEVDDG